jgi:hypothetical protein
MRLPNIDKDIIAKFSQGVEMHFYKKIQGRSLRFYRSKDKKIILTIANYEDARDLIDLYTRIMVVRRDDFKVVITRYKNQVVVLMSDHIPFIVKLEKPKLRVKEQYDVDDEHEEDDDEYIEEMPYAYTNGRWCPCPYCGSRRISTFWDGTAQCDDCKREFRYL